jgi:hypothetical protein
MADNHKGLFRDEQRVANFAFNGIYLRIYDLILIYIKQLQDVYQHTYVLVYILYLHVKAWNVRWGKLHSIEDEIKDIL